MWPSVAAPHFIQPRGGVIGNVISRASPTFGDPEAQNVPVGKWKSYDMT